MDYKDYYQSLGVPRTASQAEIKKAYRKLAREHHPDVKPGDTAAERRFKDINEANAVLSDPAKRKQYDALGANWEAYSRAGGGDPFAAGGPFAAYGFGDAGQGGRVRYEFRTSGDAGGFSDFFRTFFGGAAEAGGPTASTRRGASTATRPAGQRATGGQRGASDFEDILSGMGFESMETGAGGGVRGGAGAVPQTVEATAELTLEEAFHGTSRIVEVDGKRLEVTIPRGVDNGSRIRLKGKGGNGRDLFVVAKVRPNGTYSRRGADLERELPISLGEALLGAEVPVTTLGGRVLLRIPAGTQTGRTFRLKGRGMPRLNGDPGDQYVKVRVVLPTGLDAEATKAAETFLAAANQPDPRAGSPDATRASVS
jgi:curved DNA-binding protein